MDAMMHRVQLLMQQGRYAEARGMLMQGLSAEPEDAGLNAMLALSLRMENRASEALAPAQRAVTADPHFAFGYFVLGLVYEGMEQFKQALTAANRAVQLDPTGAENHGLCASLLMRGRKWDDAIDAAKRGLEIDPHHSQCLSVLAAVNNQLGRVDEASQVLGQTLREDPEDAYALANVGWNHLRRQDPKEAMRYFKEALRIEPDLEWARYGAIEALKSRNVFYRWLLLYFFKMGALSGGAQFGIIFGLFIVYRIAGRLRETNPELAAYIGPFLVAYLVFAYATWVGMNLANCFLLLHPFGRLALTRKEKRGALTLGTMLVFGIGMLVADAVYENGLFFLLGMVSIMCTLPLVGVQNAGTKKGRRIALGSMIAIFGCYLFGVLLLYPPLFTGGLIIWIAYMWLIGPYVARN